MNELDEIVQRGKDRLAQDAERGLPCLSSPYDYLTENERTRLHELKLQLPTFKTERQAARERLRARRSKA